MPRETQPTQEDEQEKIMRGKKMVRLLGAFLIPAAGVAIGAGMTEKSTQPHNPHKIRVEVKDGEYTASHRSKSALKPSVFAEELLGPEDNDQRPLTDALIEKNPEIQLDGVGLNQEVEIPAGEWIDDIDSTLLKEK